MTTLLTLLQIEENPAETATVVLAQFSLKLFLRLLLDLFAVWALIRIVYFKVYRKRELFFTFFVFNVVIFLLCFLLNKVDLSMGAAFGLFAVFSMLRYRTEDVSVKDMSYLFLVIAMGLINAVTKIRQVPLRFELEFLFALNGIIILIVYVLEGNWLFRREHVQLITYDNLDLLKEPGRARLMDDIFSRTGIRAHRVVVQKIDFLKLSAQLKVYYFEDKEAGKKTRL